VTEASPAGAATPKPTPTSTASVQRAQLQSQIRTEDTQVAILKELRAIDNRLGNVNDRPLNTNTGVAKLNTRVLNANNQLAKLVAGNNLLIEDAPSASGGQRARQGDIPQLPTYWTTSASTSRSRNTVRAAPRGCGSAAEVNTYVS
jgi:hypothetical protein